MREVPRSSHAEFSPAPHRPDPVELLESQAASRVPELVPIRYGRMLVSPFTFYRGAALIMAADLASTPSSGLTPSCAATRICPTSGCSRRRIGGWCSTSTTSTRRSRGHGSGTSSGWRPVWRSPAATTASPTRSAARSCCETVAGYRKAMREFAGMGNLDVWYSRLEVDELIAQLRSQVKKSQLKRAEKTLAKARTKDSLPAFSKLTQMVDGQPRIVSDPPLIERVEELVRRRPIRRGAGEPARAAPPLPGVASDRSADPARGVPAGRHRPQGGGGGQCRHPRLDRADARPRRRAIRCSCSSRRRSPRCSRSSSPRARYANHGERVVAGQHLMQATSDIFLGWLHVEAGIDGCRETSTFAS